MLIITGCGHSGTLFVATLFHISHEPLIHRSAETACVRAWQDKEFARQWVKENFMGVERECNSFLVPFADAIRQEFPECNIFQLVRDPRNVVRSLISNDLYSGDNVSYHNIKLFDKSPIGEKWEELNQFQKTCWYWRLWNKKLRKLGCPVIRLEDLRGSPVHSKLKTFPCWKDWTKEQKDYFNKIVWPEAKYYGYEKI